MTVPQGTLLEVRLETPLSSRSARPEDRVRGSVARPVVADRRVLIPAGTRLEGLVEDARPAERPIRGGRLDLAFDRVVLVDGRAMPIVSRVTSVSDTRKTRRQAEKAGIGALLGGLLGSVIGGTPGGRRRGGRQRGGARRGRRTRRRAARRDDADPAARTTGRGRRLARPPLAGCPRTT